MREIYTFSKKKEEIYKIKPDNFQNVSFVNEVELFDIFSKILLLEKWFSCMYGIVFIEN